MWLRVHARVLRLSWPQNAQRMTLISRASNGLFGKHTLRADMGHGHWEVRMRLASKMERPRGRYHTGASSPLSPSVFRAPKAAEYKP